MTEINSRKRDELIVAWQSAKKVLSEAQIAERAARDAMVAYCFPSGTEGTNRLELGQGYSLKMVQPYVYKLDEAKIDEALDELAKMGNEGAFLADGRLVNFKPTLSVREYRQLAPQYAAIINKVLTVTLGAPQVEIEEPKDKDKPNETDFSNLVRGRNRRRRD